MRVQDLIRDIPDFPKPGILFADITPVLAHPEAFDEVIMAMSGLIQMQGVNKILGVESRGFIFGAPVAQALGLPFIPVRKPGKLPADVVKVEYELEYGTDALEIHTDALEAGDRVAVVDDLLATGGTVEAVCKLVESQGAHVSASVFMIELTALGGRDRLTPRPVYSLIQRS